MSELKSELRRVSAAALPLLPGLLVVYLSFNAGGFFPGTQAYVTLVLCLLLALRILFAQRPLAGLSRGLGVAAGALALYAAWGLISGTWSGAHARALLSFDLALLYLLALLLFGTVPRRRSQLRWLLRGIAAGILVVGTVALITRLLPDVWPIAPNLAENRLSYPLTYWNALGVLVALGMVLCLHLTSSKREPPVVRVLGAAALPILAATLLLTFSRGGIAAAIVGLVLYMVLARPRSLLSGLLASVPACTVALLFAYNANLLATQQPTTAAAVAQGHDVARAVVACALGAALLRALLLFIDDPVARFRLPRRTSRIVRFAAAGAAIVALLAVTIAVNLPHRVSSEYDRFVKGNAVSATDLRQRLTDPGNNGRLDHWRVANHDFQQHPLDGTGAGTFQLAWARLRPSKDAALSVTNAHSLYMENLSDVGLVGSVLLVISIITVLVGFALRLGGPNRTVCGAFLAIGVAWGLHAGIDWDWQMPALTLPFFATGGAALATSSRRARFRPPLAVAPRVILAAALVALAVVPFQIALSQAHLSRSLSAFRADHCQRAVSEARSSSDVLGNRPEPYEVTGYCELGSPTSVAAMQKAVDRDPNDWEYHYGLALAQASVGQDPMPEARLAARLNPQEPVAQAAEILFARGGRAAWQSQAARLPLPERLSL